MIKKGRDQGKVKGALAALKTTAQGTGNLLPPIIDAVRIYASIGEISGVLREVFGEYKES